MSSKIRPVIMILLITLVIPGTSLGDDYTYQNGRRDGEEGSYSHRPTLGADPMENDQAIMDYNRGQAVGNAEAEDVKQHRQLQPRDLRYMKRGTYRYDNED